MGSNAVQGKCISLARMAFGPVWAPVLACLQHQRLLRARVADAFALGCLWVRPCARMLRESFSGLLGEFAVASSARAPLSSSAHLSKFSDHPCFVQWSPRF